MCPLSFTLSGFDGRRRSRFGLVPPEEAARMTTARKADRVRWLREEIDRIQLKELRAGRPSLWDGPRKAQLLHELEQLRAEGFTGLGGLGDLGLAVTPGMITMIVQALRKAACTESGRRFIVDRCGPAPEGCTIFCQVGRQWTGTAVLSAFYPVCRLLGRDKTSALIDKVCGASDADAAAAVTGAIGLARQARQLPVAAEPAAEEVSAAPAADTQRAEWARMRAARKARWEEAVAKTARKER